MKKLSKEDIFITLMANSHDKIAYIQKGKHGKKNIAIFDKAGVANIIDVDVVYFDEFLTNKMIEDLKNRENNN